MNSFLDNWFWVPVATVTATFWHKTAGMSPNQITVTSAALGLLSVAMMGCGGCSWLAALCVLASYYFDCLDGIVARKFHLCSQVGAQLDVVGDFFTNALRVAFLMWNGLSLVPAVVLVVAVVGVSVANANLAKQTPLLVQWEIPMLNGAYTFVEKTLVAFPYVASDVADAVTLALGPGTFAVLSAWVVWVS